jgi:hypothetical protein
MLQTPPPIGVFGMEILVGRNFFKSPFRDLGIVNRKFKYGHFKFPETRQNHFAKSN